jgi:phosphoribosylformylglycinamidine synthase
VKGEPPHLDLEREAALQRVLLDAIRVEPRLVLSAHDVSDGGLAVALAECCVGDGAFGPEVGAVLGLPPSEETLAERLFGEAPSRVVVTVAPGALDDLVRRASASGLVALPLGVTGGDRLVLRDAGTTRLDVSLASIRARRAACLEAIVGEE